MSHRIAKINKLIHHELSQIFLEIVGKTSEFITITEVDTSSDLSYSRIWITALKKPEDTLKLLNRNIYEIQGLLNKRLHLKKIPRIKIIIDNSGEKIEKINEILNKNL